IANICWLDNEAVRLAKGSGPLMISFRHKDVANRALDYNLAIHGINCNTSIYVPRPPQCYRCQDWGHRAAECKSEVAKCGKCTNAHETKD
ncbi:hypothetical protein B0H21DRAFT_681100, partial [Amylocystis lapponica]